MLKLLNRFRLYLKLGIPSRKELIIINIIFIAVLLPISFSAPNFSQYYVPIALIILNVLAIARIGFSRYNEIIRFLEFFEDTENLEILGELLGYKEFRNQIEAFRKVQADQKLGIRKFELVRGEFLDNFSHEIKTPMFAVLGYLETLQNPKVADEKMKQNFLSKAYTHAQYLNTLLNDMIDLAFLQSGQNRLKLEKSDIIESINEVLETYKEKAEEKEIYLTLDAKESEIYAEINVEKFQLALSHLISNALKYTEEGGITISVSKSDKVKISVTDTGAGIPENEIDRIFERLYKTKRDRDRKMKGSGMGLAIVKHIIIAHNAKISVESKEGVGTTFLVELAK